MNFRQVVETGCILSGKFCFLIVTLIFCVKSGAQDNSLPGWKHFSIDAILPGSSWGTGGTALADFNKDGKPDISISRRNTKSAYWYEHMNDSIWIPHLMGTSETLLNSLGTAVLDIDHDSWTDVVFNGIWFRNPGILDKDPDTLWESYLIKAGGHDAAAADIDGNGVDDLLIYDGNKLAWYNTSDNMREIVISSGHNDHGGVAPHGFGDLDGDKDMDVIIPGFWFSNPGNLTGNWELHEWPFEPVKNASYGRSIRAWIFDINNDGQNDIVYSHCDTGGSHVYYVLNEGSGKGWESVMLPDPPVRKGDVEGTGSFHSLGIADFNLDGLPDIFAGEQEDPDVYMESEGKVAMKPGGLKERGVIWYNESERSTAFNTYLKPSFKPYVIHLDNPGWHDAVLCDIDNDGDTDIVSKIWNADGPVYHLDYWRNELITKSEK
ncbi:MAG: VCBS repeat-containing protein [Bacteroidota bacterium]